VDRAAIERKIIIDAILKTWEEKEQELEWPAIERKMIVDAIVKAQGRRNKAAAILGWSRSRLYRKMTQHGIEA
jgi:DNA-binding NtrC family response regulator